MLATKYWGCLLACLAPLSMAEDSTMSSQQQCAEYGVYQDASENWIDCADNGGEQNNDQNDAGVSYDQPYIEDTYVAEPDIEETYVDDSYVEEPYVEQPYVEESYSE